MKKDISWKKSFTGYAFIFPQLVMFLIFYFYPIIEGFRLSFYRITPKENTFVGLNNFKELFENPVFGIAVRNTLIYIIAIVFLTVAFGLFVASAIFDKNAKYVSFIRGCYYLPCMVSMVVMSMVWNFLLNPANGLICYYLRVWQAPAVNLLGNKNTVLGVIIFVTFVSNVGQAIILFIAAMVGVPSDLFEVAEIDGANRFQRTWHILFPMIRPTLLYVTVINVVGVLKMFVAVQLLTDGGPNNASVTMMYFLYQNAFKWNNTGAASAIGVLMFLIAILFLIPMFRVITPTDRREGM